MGDPSPFRATKGRRLESPDLNLLDFGSHRWACTPAAWVIVGAEGGSQGQTQRGRGRQSGEPGVRIGESLPKPNVEVLSCHHPAPCEIQGKEARGGIPGRAPGCSLLYGLGLQERDSLISVPANKRRLATHVASFQPHSALPSRACSEGPGAMHTIDT